MMQLRIGNQTSFAAKSALEPFEFALESGFRAFEFFPDRGYTGSGGWDERDLGSNERNHIRRAAEASDTTLTVHAPLPFDPLKQPNDPRLQSTIEFASDIGACLLNLHLDMSEGSVRFAEALKPTLHATAKAGLRLALENTVWTAPAEFNEFFAVLRTQRSAPTKHVGMCLDLGHANVCAATQNDYCGFLDQLDPLIPILHLHLHENFGDRDSHLPLFTGPSRDNVAGIVGVLNRLKRRAFHGCAILEQWPQPASLLVEARDRLETLLKAKTEVVQAGRAALRTTSVSGLNGTQQNPTCL